MKSYYKIPMLRVALYAAGVIIFALMPSCTKVDNTLGSGLVPGGEGHLGVYRDTLGLSADDMIKAYQVYTDSIGNRNSRVYTRGAMNMNITYIGAENDPYFGKTTTASIFTGLPAEPVSPYFYRGRHKTVDSVKLTLNLKYVSGDYGKVQKFNIYSLKDSLTWRTDTMYFQSIPYEKYMDSEPLFSFEYSGKPANVDEVKLNVLPKGKEFLDEFAVADTTLFYKNKRTDYRQKYKGFVIVSSPESPKDAAVYASYMPNSYLDFYFQRDRSQAEIDADSKNKNKEITVHSQWYFSDVSTAENNGNLSIASIRHDFTGTPLDGVQRGEKIEAGGKSYIRGLGGVETMIEFGDGFFAAIEKLKPSTDYDIFINQAQMYVWVEEQSTAAYDKAFQVLGSYSDYSKMLNIADYYMSDFDLSVEAAYGGALNRNPGKGYYMMDITSFMQHALKSTDKAERRFTLAPTYTPYNPFVDGLSVIQTHGSENPIRVRLTYTLVENIK